MSRYVRLLQKGNPKADSANLNIFIEAVLCRDKMALCVCLCVHVRTCVRPYLRANVCMWDVCMYVYMCLSMCSCVCMHVFVYVFVCLHYKFCECVCVCARASTIIAMLQL